MVACGGGATVASVAVHADWSGWRDVTGILSMTRPSRNAWKLLFLVRAFLAFVGFFSLGIRFRIPIRNALSYGSARSACNINIHIYVTVNPKLEKDIFPSKEVAYGIPRRSDHRIFRPILSYSLFCSCQFLTSQRGGVWDFPMARRHRSMLAVC